MAITLTDNFRHCSPALRTDIDKCGTMALCSATKPETASELDDIYMSGGDFRILGAMLMNQMEIKACGIVQHSLRKFFMSNLKPMKKNIQLDSNSKTLAKIKPFILAKQKHPINNNYWRVSGGEASGQNWAIDVESKSGIPADARSFAVGERAFIKSRTAGGAMNLWAGVIVSSEVVGSKVHLVLTPQNVGSPFDDVENPTTGVLTRGPANVAPTESFCGTEPGYINDTRVEFWMERIQETLCSGDRWREWRNALKKFNPLYSEFYDLPEAESNKQRLEAFDEKMFQNALWGNPISEAQTLDNYRSLPVANNFLSDSGLGIAGGLCDSWKANAVGFINQLKICKQVYDAGGDQLDLWSLMDAIYILSRVRQGIGSAAAKEFDLFTDSDTADLIEQGFIKLFKDRSLDTMRMTQEITSGTNAEFGFNYRRFRLVGKCHGITLNVITDLSFDDWLAEWTDYSNEQGDGDLINGGRAIWLLDLTGMYIGIVDSSREARSSGDIKDLVKSDPAYLCVKSAPKKEVIIVDAVYVPVVECPAASLLLWNFSGEIPESTKSDSRPNYIPSASVVAYYGY